MNTIRKGIAGLLLLAMFLTNSLSAAAVSLPDQAPPESEQVEDSLHLQEPDLVPEQPQLPSVRDDGEPEEEAAPPRVTIPEEYLPQPESQPEAEPEEDAVEQSLPQLQAPAANASPDSNREQGTQLEATVAPAQSNYTVEIPEGLHLGQLSPNRDFSQDYAVKVTMPGADGSQCVTVRADYPSIPLYREGGSDTLTCMNRFGTEGTRQFYASATENGHLHIAKSDIASAAPGRYTGTLNFNITYEYGLKPTTPPDPEVSPDVPQEPDEPEVSPEISPELPTLQPPTPPTQEPTVPPVPEDQHLTATISMRNEYDFNKPSMCDGLFHRTVDIDVKDGMATMTVYVIDPVPAFPQYDKTVSNIKLHYNGKEYPATLDQSKKTDKYFDVKPSFIDPAGTYPASPITVTLPYEALALSTSGKLTCTAFVNAVMNTDVTFYVVLDGLPDSPPAPPAPPTPTTPPKPTPSPTTPDAPLPPPPSDGGSGGTGSGSTYYTANVSMRHAQDFNKLSMCSKLFYPKADIACTGDTATLTLYVIDPVPQFPEEGTPVKNVSLHYQGSSYSASVNSGSKVMKKFPAAAGFIDEGGTYPATPIKVQLPMQALRDSVNKALKATCYVNAVMHTDVEFYVVLADLTQVSGPASNRPASGGGSLGTASEEAETGDAITLTLGEGESVSKVCSVSTRKITDFNTPSMSDNMFYDQAELLFRGDNVQITLYIVDPVPGFEADGTPLANPTVTYNGQKYAVTLHPESPVTKHFPPIPGFTEEAGDYTTTPMTVILPKQAVADSLDGKLTGSAFVNTVMKTDVEFYLVLDDVTDPADEPAQEEEALPEAVTAEAPQGPVRIDTKLFPQILVYLLLTAAILGGAGYILWKKHQ